MQQGSTALSVLLLWLLCLKCNLCELQLQQTLSKAWVNSPRDTSLQIFLKTNSMMQNKKIKMTGETKAGWQIPRQCPPLFPSTICPAWKASIWRLSLLIHRYWSMWKQDTNQTLSLHKCYPQNKHRQPATNRLSSIKHCRAPHSQIWCKSSTFKKLLHHLNNWNCSWKSQICILGSPSIKSGPKRPSFKLILLEPRMVWDICICDETSLEQAR